VLLDVPPAHLALEHAAPRRPLVLRAVAAHRPPVEVRQHPDQLEVYYTGRLVETLPRLRGALDARIDYRHVIWSLVHSPARLLGIAGARSSSPRPSSVAPSMHSGSHARRAEVEYVRILHLAASTMESTVEAALVSLLSRDEPFDYVAVQAIASPRKPTVPTVSIPSPDLAVYDALLVGGVA